MSHPRTDLRQGPSLSHEAILALSLSQMQYTGRGGNHADEANKFRGWNYMAIMAIAKAAAKSRVQIFDSRKKIEADASAGDQAGAVADDDFRWWHLLKRPNPWQTGAQLRMEQAQQLQLHGMAMTWNVKNGFGKTVMRLSLPMAILTPVSPGQMAEFPFGAVRVQNIQWVAWHAGLNSHALTQSRYHYISDRVIGIEDITIAAYPHAFLRGDGYSPTTAADAFIELCDASNNSAMDQYRRGPNRRVLVEPPRGVGGTNEELDAFQRRLDRRLRDSSSSVVAMPLDKVHEVTIDPTDMEYLRVAEIYGPGTLAMHGVSKSVVGLQDGMTYGSIAAANNAFIEFTVQPVLNLLADEETATVQAEEGPAFTVALEADRAHDPELRESQIQSDISAGAITVGELRELRGRPRYGDERDDMIAGSEAIRAWAPGRDNRESRREAAAGPTEPEPAIAGLPAAFLPEAKSLLVSKTTRDRPPVIAFDLDGTLAGHDPATFDEFSIGDPIPETVDLLRLLSDAGCGVVIFTSRSNDLLVQRWLDEHAIPWDGINESPWSEKTDAKVLADLYIDDRAIAGDRRATAILADVIEHFRGTEMETRIRTLAQEQRFDEKFGYLAIPVGGELKQRIEDLRRSIDPADVVELETWPHVTVLYGIVDNYRFEFTERMRLLRRPEFRLSRRWSVFGADGERPALVIELEGDDLHSLHGLCEACFPHVASEFDSYRPHITVAYITAEAASKYDGVDHGLNLAATGAKLLLRQPDQPDIAIPLQ